MLAVNFRGIPPPNFNRRETTAHRGYTVYLLGLTLGETKSDRVQRSAIWDVADGETSSHSVVLSLVDVALSGHKNSIELEEIRSGSIGLDCHTGLLLIDFMGIMVVIAEFY